MLIELKNLFNNEGETLIIDETADYSDFELNGTKPFAAPVSIVGKITNSIGIVKLSAAAKFVYHAPCDRCAVMVDRPMEVPVEHLLVAKLNNEENDSFILVEDMTLDLDELVLSDIVLSLPSKFLCSDDCRGLCAQCGKNLNDGPCDCQKPVDPRLEALRDLLK